MAIARARELGIGGEGKPAFLLDFASHFAIDDDTFLKYPPVFIKAIGISHVGNILSGTLGGQMLPDEASRMEPLPGFSESYLPGGKELEREREYRRDGVPIPARVVEGLEEVRSRKKGGARPPRPSQSEVSCRLESKPAAGSA